MKKVAPRVYAWVERMNGPEEFQDHTVNRQGSELFGHDEVPEGLLDMMRYVRDEYLPEITAHIEFTNSWLAARPEIEPGTPCAIPLGANEKSRRFIGRAGFNYRGVEIETMVHPSIPDKRFVGSCGKPTTSYKTPNHQHQSVRLAFH